MPIVPSSSRRNYTKSRRGHHRYSYLGHVALKGVTVSFSRAEKHRHLHHVPRQSSLSCGVGTLATHRREGVECSHQDLQLGQQGLFDHRPPCRRTHEVSGFSAMSMPSREPCEAFSKAGRRGRGGRMQDELQGGYDTRIGLVFR